jgi:hypothetical protein
MPPTGQTRWTRAGTQSRKGRTERQSSGPGMPQHATVRWDASSNSATLARDAHRRVVWSCGLLGHDRRSLRSTLGKATQSRGRMVRRSRAEGACRALPGRRTAWLSGYNASGRGKALGLLVPTDDDARSGRQDAGRTRSRQMLLHGPMSPIT